VVIVPEIVVGLQLLPGKEQYWAVAGMDQPTNVYVTFCARAGKDAAIATQTKSNAIILLIFIACSIAQRRITQRPVSSLRLSEAGATQSAAAGAM
jgi:hypothetical protein